MRVERKTKQRLQIYVPWHSHSAGKIDLSTLNSHLSTESDSGTVFGEPAFRFDGGGAAHAGSGDGLTINVVNAISRHVDAGDVGLNLRSVERLEIAVFVNGERRRKRLGVRKVTDG